MLMDRFVSSKMSRLVSGGFALPTVLLASTLMMALLLMAVQANTAVRAELNAQYYNQQARLASQSGSVRAQQCLIANAYVATWSDAKPLMPNTDCAGNVVGGYSAYVYSSGNIRTSFSVPAPTVTNGVQRVSVNGKLELVRTSSNTAWRSYNQAIVSQVGADVSFNNVAFGYISSTGAFFGTIGINGEVKTVGYNGYGQLGTGDQASATTPRTFILPPGAKAAQLFTNFLSVGFDMFALTTDGRVYGAGANDLGHLGNGTFTHPVTTPTQFILPAGEKATYVSSLGWTSTYVITDNHNIYASGACAYGLLGSSYTIAGCSNRSSYVRVNLPTPNLSDLNTIPEAVSSGVPADNIVSDRYNVAVRMKGGRVYVWGINDVGVLGTGNNTNSSTPVKLGTYGDPGKPKATQLAFDGESLYVLDDTGAVNVVGNGTSGSLAGAPTQLKQQGTGKCVNNQYNNTAYTQARIYDCIDAVSQQMTFNPNGTITTSPNSSTTLCLDNQGSVAADNNPVQWWACNGTGAQQWEFRDDGSIYNPGSNRCLNNAGNNPANDAPLGIWSCNNAFPDQLWWIEQSKKLTPVPTPAAAGTVAQIATDQWTVLFRMSNGEVWGAGGNDRGQIGNGVTGKNISTKLTKMTLPAGRQAAFVYTTKNGIQGSVYANTYVVLDNGEVWGCGANTFGQLGNGTTSASVGTPVKMNLPPGVVAKTVQSGNGTTVVLTTAGSIFTVGNNSHGQLGDGTTTNSSTPKANKYTNTFPPVLY